MTYLRRNPEARDTIEGICQYWLAENGIFRDKEVVEKALNFLVEQKQLTSRRIKDGRIIYALNPESK